MAVGPAIALRGRGVHGAQPEPELSQCREAAVAPAAAAAAALTQAGRPGSP